MVKRGKKVQYPSHGPNWTDAENTNCPRKEMFISKRVWDLYVA
jgi:hypothetical protein